MKIEEEANAWIDNRKDNKNNVEEIKLILKELKKLLDKLERLLYIRS